MRIELTPGGGNVIRFPVEQRARPSLDLLRDIAPDVREVGLVAEAFGLDEPPFNARDEADRAMAEKIRMTSCWPENPEERKTALASLLQPLVERAVIACREAHKAALRSDDAAEAFVNAQTQGGYWLQPLEDASTMRSTEAAMRLIEAYVAAEEAHGAARAIARRGETWRPFDLREEERQLFFGAAGR